MATQVEVQELADKVNKVDEGLATAKTAIEAEFAELEKKLSEGVKPGTEIDLGPLHAAIDQLGGVAEGVENIKANPPAPAPVAAAAEPGTHAEQQAADQTGQAPANADGTAQTA